MIDWFFIEVCNVNSFKIISKIILPLIYSVDVFLVAES